MKTLAIVGFGSRGQMFANLLKKESEARLIAVAEPVESSRKYALTLGVQEELCFSSAEEFFRRGKICDAVFICTQDSQHIDMTLTALKLGYDVCLEKPAATTVEDCIKIRDTASRLGRKVMLTHVLRYAPFFRQIKEWIEEGRLGEIVTINQTENIAYWHFALSYVRGPWRIMSESSPTIIAKCCHDLDIINWLMPSECESVSSFGGLYYFNQAHAPEGSAKFCADCRKETRENCLFNAYKIYPERVKMPVVGGTARLRGEDIYNVLDEKKDVISKCVFCGENDAVDNQVVNMSFKNGATAHLTMTAFSDRCYRFIKVHGTKGEVYGDADEGILYLTEYGKPMQKVDTDLMVEEENKGGHGGGDYYLLKDFIDYITLDTPSLTRTTIADSIQSHVIGFKAEESRLHNGKLVRI